MVAGSPGVVVDTVMGVDTATKKNEPNFEYKDTSAHTYTQRQERENHCQKQYYSRMVL